MAQKEIAPIEKENPIFEVLFREGNWGAHDYQLTDMVRELVIKYNELVQHINSTQ